MKPQAINSLLPFVNNGCSLRKIFVLTIVLALAVPLFSQETFPKDSVTSDYYLQRSKSQKISGFIFLGIGVTTLALLSKGDTDFDILPALAIGGIAATVVSIPLFISSGKNKRKAMSLSVKNEKAFILRNGSFTQKSFPALSVRLSLVH